MPPRPRIVLLAVLLCLTAGVLDNAAASARVSTANSPRAVTVPLVGCSEGGTITVNITWDATCVHVVSDIVVNDGVTLTVQPSVIVKMAAGATIQSAGTLNAVGTSGQRNTFTSYRDDSVGGDTNGDGASTGVGADWGSLWLYGGTAPHLSLGYADVRFGDCCGYPGYPNFGLIHNQHINAPPSAATVAIDHSTITDSSGTGISIANGALLVANSTIANNGWWGGTIWSWDGIWVSGSTLVLTNSTIANNTLGLGLSVSGGTATISNNVFTGNGRGRSWQRSQTGCPDHREQWFGEQAERDRAWRNGLDEHHLNNTNPTLPYLLSDIVVNDGVTLTVQPGVIVKMAAGATIQVAGTLNAVGTSGQRITFTSYRDDSVGGDTNGDGASTGVGADWGSLWLYGGTAPHLSLGYADVRFGDCCGYPGYPNFGLIHNQHINAPPSAATVAIDHSTITDSSGTGISIANGALLVANSTIANNGWWGGTIWSWDGIWVSGSTLVLTNSTIANNTLGLGLSVSGGR